MSAAPLRSRSFTGKWCDLTAVRGSPADRRQPCPFPTSRNRPRATDARSMLREALSRLFAIVFLMRLDDSLAN
jgi:hypothetical protein